jgi:hypothetical protein
MGRHIFGISRSDHYLVYMYTKGCALIFLSSSCKLDEAMFALLLQVIKPFKEVSDNIFIRHSLVME